MWIGIPVLVFWWYAWWATSVTVTDGLMVIRRLGRSVSIPLEEVVSVGRHKLGFWQGGRMVANFVSSSREPIDLPAGWSGFYDIPMWHKAVVAEIRLRLERQGRVLDIPDAIRPKRTCYEQ